MRTVSGIRGTIKKAMKPGKTSLVWAIEYVCGDGEGGTLTSDLQQCGPRRFNLLLALNCSPLNGTSVLSPTLLASHLHRLIVWSGGRAVDCDAEN